MLLKEFKVNIKVLGTLNHSEVDVRTSLEIKDGYVRFNCSPTVVDDLIEQLKKKEYVSEAKRIKNKKLKGRLLSL